MSGPPSLPRSLSGRPRLLPRGAGGRVLLRLLPALSAVALMVPAAIALGGSNASGVPLLPDLDQEWPTQLVVTQSGTSWRLGFRSAVRNVGDGPLIITGHRLWGGQNRMRADQVIRNAGAPASVVRGTGRLRYVHSPDHRHWHLMRFDRYELRRAGSGRVVVRDRKTGFCLGDRYEVTTRDLPARAPEPVYTSSCGLDRPGLDTIREGISVGYGDDYVANLEGQYLPLDGLRRGLYVLVHDANPNRLLVESSYANNAASALLRLRWRRGEPRITVLALCPTTDRCGSRG